MTNFLNSTFNISGAGPTYQQLGLQEKTVQERTVINEPEVSAVTVSLAIQSGANANSEIDINYEYLRLGALGIKKLNVSTRDDADSAVKSIEGAIDKVSQQRAVFGAYMNRLQGADNVNGNIAENLQDTESKLRDTDMAKEMVIFWKQNILEQVGQSIMTQSNQNSKNILNLLQ
jgi:flagellin